MFDIPSVSCDYNDPWDLPVNVRLQIFRSAARKVIYYKDGPDTSSFRYRCYNMAQSVNESLPDVSASWFYATDGPRLLNLVKEAEILVVHRSTYSPELAHMITVAKSFGTRVLFDIDDFIFDPHYTLHVLQSLDQYQPQQENRQEAMFSHWFAQGARYRSVLELAEGLIVPNDYLAARARESLDVPVFVIPNFMGREQLDYSAEITRRKTLLGNARDEFTDVGYFSGTPTHNRDFAIASGALARLMRRNTSVRLRLAGYIELKGTALAGLEDRIEFSPLTDYLSLQRLIAQTEINIAPLQDTTFTNCKSELKFFDAAAVSIPTLASPTFAMSRAIDHGETGLIVRDDEWDDALEWMVTHYEEEGMTMGRRAYEVAHSKYTPAAQSAVIAEVLSL